MSGCPKVFRQLWSSCSYPDPCSYRVNLGGEGVEVDEEIDAIISESAHAVAVVSIGIDMVYTDSVCAKRLHEGRVERTLSAVNERVIGGELVGDT